MATEKVIAYVTKLAGRPVEADTPFTLSSARKAQLASWLRREDIGFDYADIDRQSLTVSQILKNPVRNDAPAPHERKPAAAANAAAPAAPSALAAGIGVGIDIESLDNMPEAADVRAEPFYRDNFSPRELAYCLERADLRLSLCGLWAAKEAIVKAGAAAKPKRGGLAHIEIQHDPSGAPTFPGCALSIAHEATLAVAVCVRFGGAQS
jgi:phosphopantetheine--protein transferase-like protein